MRVAVLGPGGVGGFVAGALVRAGNEVTLVAREETAQAIARDGLRVTSVRLGDFEARPRVATRLDEDVDVLFVATKATTLDAALARVASQPGLVVPLLNGLDHVAHLRERFGPRVVAATIRIESDRRRAGVIVQTSPFLLVQMASEDPGVRPTLDEVADLLRAAGIPADVLDSEAQVMWSKLVRLNALALTTSATDKPIGYIRSDPEWRAKLEACVREAAAVAAAEGASVDPEATMGELDSAHAELGSSMQRDIAAGHEPELDAIAGAVRRAASRHGLACPTIAELNESVFARSSGDYGTMKKNG